MRNTLITFAVLAVLMLAGRYLATRRPSSTRPVHVPPTDGGFTLRQPRRDAIMGGIALVMSAMVLGSLTFRAWDAAGASLAVALAATFLAVCGALYLFASAFRSCVIVRETGLERVSVFGRRLMVWTSLSKIAFNPAQHWFFLTMSDGSHLWLRVDTAGIGDFAIMALRRAGPAVLAADPVAREELEGLAAAARKARHE